MEKSVGEVVDRSLPYRFVRQAQNEDTDSLSERVGSFALCAFRLRNKNDQL